MVTKLKELISEGVVRIYVLPAYAPTSHTELSVYALMQVRWSSVLQLMSRHRQLPASLQRLRLPLQVAASEFTAYVEPAGTFLRSSAKQRHHVLEDGVSAVAAVLATSVGRYATTTDGRRRSAIRHTTGYLSICLCTAADIRHPASDHCYRRQEL